MQRGSASGTRIQPNAAPFSETTSLQAGTVYLLVYHSQTDYISMKEIGYLYDYFCEINGYLYHFFYSDALNFM